MPEPTSDADIMRLVQAGEVHRFGELIRRYRQGLLRTASSRLGSRSAAEDAVQETFLSAFKSRATFDPRFHFRTWLWTILINHCRSVWRKRERSPVLMLPSQDRDGGEWLSTAGDWDQPAPDAGLLARERRELLEQLLSRLPPDQATALELRFYGGLKFQQIADAMACSLATAKNRVRFGLAKLSEMSQTEMSGVPANRAGRQGESSRDHYPATLGENG